MITDGKITSKVILFDLDGTVYICGKPIGDAINTLNKIRDKGIRVGFLTNNSSLTDKGFIDRLKKYGLWDNRDFVYSSLDCAISYIKNNYADKTFFLVASKKVKSLCRKNGIKVATKRQRKNADGVLFTFYQKLKYDDLQTTHELLTKGKIFIATHPDNTCPAPNIASVDLGSFIALFKESCGVSPNVITGKPYKEMAEEINKMLNLSPSDITVVGDRLNTDIAFGLNAGYTTVLVLTGDTTMEKYNKSGLSVDLVLNSIDDMVNFI